MSRYPSAHGHTPGYKSISSSVYPSALDTSRRVDMDLGLSVRIDSLFLFFCVHDVFEQGGLGGRTSSSLLGSTIDRELSSLSVSSSMITSLFFSSSSFSDWSLYWSHAKVRKVKWVLLPIQELLIINHPELFWWRTTSLLLSVWLHLQEHQDRGSRHPPHQLQPQHLILRHWQALQEQRVIFLIQYLGYCHTQSQWICETLVSS